MGLIIRYAVEFPDAGLKVSNDPWSGDFVLDAEIQARMLRGTAGSSYEIKIYDLPDKKTAELNDKLKERKQAKVVIKLGYFESPLVTVMEGVYSKLTSTVENDRLVLSIKGLESGTHALQHGRFRGKLPAMSVKDAVKKILSEAEMKEGEIVLEPEVEEFSAQLKPISFSGDNLLPLMNRIANLVDAELLVCDKKLRIGQSIKDSSYSAEFSRDVNLAQFRPFAQSLPEEDQNRLQKLAPTDVQGFLFTIAGDPKLRPGQTVKTDEQGFLKSDGAEFRVHSVVHKFSTSAGYTCEGAATRTGEGGNAARQQKAVRPLGADAIAEKLAGKIEGVRAKSPLLEIAAVNQYSAGTAAADKAHRATLFFGQRFDGTESQPSVAAEVESKDEQQYENKPVVSPFAWRKCGLVVPVYPGMKSVLAHNLALRDDVLVTGFLWSEQPAIEPPKNNEGDWWLCLPIDFDTSKPPTDGTKAVNDLTANDGNRVIEVKGLKITVGKDKLKGIGERPQPGADDEFLIEHKSGTKIQIAADGAITIDAKKVSIKGDLTVEGNVEIK